MTVLILILFCLAATTFAARNLQLLVINNATQMVCLPLLGSTTFEVFGGVANVGNIFFASALYGIALKYHIFGIAETRRAVINIFFALTLVFGSIVILNIQAPNPFYQIPARIIAASFIAFWLVQSLFMVGLDSFRRTCPLITVPLLLIAVQAFDSVIYFPCAFWGTVPDETLLRFALVGFLTKSMIAIMAVPFLAFSLWRLDQNPFANRPRGLA